MATLRICGIDVHLVFSSPEDWATNGMGRSNELTNRITLRTGMQKDVEGQTLLHEVLHMIVDMNQLEKIKNDETIIAVLSNALNAFLRDNDLGYWGAPGMASDHTNPSRTA